MKTLLIDTETAELRDAPNELERRVAERTAELSEANAFLKEQVEECGRAESAMQESEERYRAFVENSSEAIWRFEVEPPISITLPVDEQIRQLYEHSYLAECNNLMAEMYGYGRAEEFIGARLEELLPSSNPENIAYLSAFINTGYRLVDAESQETDREGGPRYFLNNLVGIVKNGFISRAWGTQREITESKRMEAERQVLFEIMQGVSITSNLDELLGLIHQALRKILYAENCFVALYDKTRGLFYKRFYVDQFGSNTSPQMAAKSCGAYVFRTGRPLLMTPQIIDEMLERGDIELIGERSPSWLGVPLKTATETIGVLVVQHYHDLHAYSERDLEFLSSVGSQIALAIERKRAEEAIEEAKQRAIIKYEQLLERISSLSQTLGTARHLQTIFRALRDFAQVSAPCDSIIIFLYDSERNERSAAYAWTDGDELDMKEIPAVKVGDGPAGRAIASQAVLITHDFINVCSETGRVLVGPWRDERLPDSDLMAPMTIMGKTIGLIEIQSYEAHAYRGEHSIAMRMAANLAAIAIENVRLIEREREKEEQLRQSQKMEAVGKLAGGVAHDFNNLLTAINGYSDLSLRRLEDNHPLRRNIEEIKKAGERAASLTRQLLAFSRKQVLQPVVLDLNSVIVEMFKMLQRLIGEDIDLLPVLDPSLGQVKADPGQIQQVLMNLAVNARDAMPRGGKLTIKTANIYIDEEYAGRHISVKPGHYVVLSISDTGCGMDAEIQARIFDPFFTTKEVGKGTGLGLSTVYGIVKQSGGNIWVYSEVERGTTFKIYLPRADQAAVEINHDEKIAQAPAVGTETVLLVEDEEVVRNMTREILEMSGYKVVEAVNGIDGLKVCKEHDGVIQLMLTDVVMPQMGGRALAEQAVKLRPEMRVLYMSGYAEDAIVHHGVLDKGMAFIEKPFTPDVLTGKIREILDSAQD
jgi:signal transduction histidine kinase/PAS domain-containing protein